MTSGTPHSPQHRGSQGDADLTVTLTIAPTLTIATIALGHSQGWW